MAADDLQRSATTIDRSACEGFRHGTVSAYRQGCRCPDARDAHRVYYKRRREGRPYRALIDATGSRRRVQALFALGHTGHTIAEHAGMNAIQIWQLAWANRPWITRPNAERIARAYRTLAGLPGASQRTRNRAAAAGYHGPLAWGADIDDPNAQPDHAETPTDEHLIDDVLVAQVLTGKAHPQRLNRAERLAAVRAGRRRGLSTTQLMTLLRVSATTLGRLERQEAA